MAKKKKQQPNHDGLNVGYLRKSKVIYPEGCVTAEQKTAFDQDLINVRTGELHLDAARYNVNLDHIFVDLDISGQHEFESKRLDMIELRRLASEGKIKTIWMRDLSRLARDLIFQEIFFRDMASFGVMVYMDGELMRDDDPDLVMLRRVLGSVHQNKAEKDSLVTRKNLYVKVMGAKDTPPTWVGRQRDAWGLIYNRETKGFDINPKTLPNVIDMFTRFVAKHGNARATASEINEMTVKGTGGYPSPQRGVWDAGKITRIIASPLYNQCTSWHDVIIPWPEKVPETVGAALYAEANRLRKMRSGGERGAPAPRTTYTYSGLIKCGYCGAPVRSHNIARPALDKSTIVYMCRSAHTSRPLCPSSYATGYVRLDYIIKDCVTQAIQCVLTARGEAKLSRHNISEAPQKKIKQISYDDQVRVLDDEAARYRELYARKITPTLELLMADLAKVEEKRRKLAAHAPAVVTPVPQVISIGLDTLLQQIDTLWDLDVRAPKDMARHQFLKELGASFEVKVHPKQSGKKPYRQIGGIMSIRAEFANLGLTGDKAVEITETMAMRNFVTRGIGRKRA